MKARWAMTISGRDNGTYGLIFFFSTKRRAMFAFDVQMKFIGERQVLPAQEILAYMTPDAKKRAVSQLDPTRDEMLRQIKEHNLERVSP